MLLNSLNVIQFNSIEQIVHGVRAPFLKRFTVGPSKPACMAEAVIPHVLSAHMRVIFDIWAGSHSDHHASAPLLVVCLIVQFCSFVRRGINMRYRHAYGQTYCFD